MRACFASVFCMALSVSGAFAQNAIVTENQRTDCLDPANPGGPRTGGTPKSQWDLSPNFNPGSTSLQGFTTDISVNHGSGSTVRFKIQSRTNNWKIDIYRLGYYHGNGACLVKTIPMSVTSPQPDPIVHDRDSTTPPTGLVDAGNWSETASWDVPSSAVSGVYIAHLVDLNDTTKENHIPFIVRADESTSDILFQTSDTTWHAYNGWPCVPVNPGNPPIPNASLYGDGVGSGPGDDILPGRGRAYKVSYNRPIATRRGPAVGGCGAGGAGPQDFLFGAEYAAIYWLEQNGYDVSYIAGVDTARSPSLLGQHKIFTSTGHDEYWDRTARDNVETARAHGLNLLFMSGNEVYWKTRWEASIDPSATPFRTLVCYKETYHLSTTSQNAQLDPADPPTWTGTWRDPRSSPPADGGRPENALTGTLTIEAGASLSRAIQVPFEMSRLRFWRNTQHVANAAPPNPSNPSGTTTTLTPNILGYEWDVSPDNNFAPGGLIYLSSTPLNESSYLIDYGTVVGNGTATHNLTLYRDPASHALVFGAGTVFWAWGLSKIHDGETTPTDPDIQQAMVNLLADMGAQQPGTLDTTDGIVLASPSTDTTPPVSTIATPPAGTTSGEGQPLVISGSASDTGGLVAGVEVSVDGGVTWHRASGTTSWTYTWNATPGTHSILSRATDDSVNTELPSSGITISVTPAGSSLFAGTAVPDSSTIWDNNSVELGVQFSASTSGSIVGLRFWKDSINVPGVSNDGTFTPIPHTAHLWLNSTQTLLASATFANETASGWQTVLFSAPVPITAGTTYTASYHTSGFYSANAGFFTTPRVNGSLTAPVNAGVYFYDRDPIFPSLTFNSDNYWVDVLFSPSN
jgi:N,N-dimethylformamidase beta subunit-like, C-terminal/Domain of unknown function (DUF4082)/Bacterial Ig domain